MTHATEDPAGENAPDQDTPVAETAADAPEGASAPAELDEAAQAQADLLDMADQLARAKADLYNQEQRFNNYVQRAKADSVQSRQLGREDVVEALIGVLDDIELARQHGELQGPFASISDKLETTLTQSFSVERFGAVGEEFDPNFHEALMHNEREGVTTDVIEIVMQPGYRVGDKVVRPARVGVVGPA